MPLRMNDTKWSVVVEVLMDDAGWEENSRLLGDQSYAAVMDTWLNQSYTYDERK